MPEGEEPAEGLDAKIAQMLMVGFRGLTLSEADPIAQDVRVRGLGSTVLFDFDVPSGRTVRNIESPEQVRALVGSLQALSEVPLLVAIDQEGGNVARLKEAYGFPPSVSHQYLGALNDPAETYRQASRMAQTLAQLGINLNLAPVVDLLANPDNPIIAGYGRSFSADPQVVVTHALEFIRAHHEQGVLCTLKHFPGHGSSAGDSHLGLVDVSDTWSRTELEPYRRLMAAGAVDAVMTAHVFNANLDPGYPATLSRATITGLLREELGYDGVVISDDMQMGAITTQYGFETAILLAIEAGVDILSFSNNLAYDENIMTRALATIRELVIGGVISEARIDESYQKVMRLKQRLQA